MLSKEFGEQLVLLNLQTCFLPRAETIFIVILLFASKKAPIGTSSNRFFISYQIPNAKVLFRQKGVSLSMLSQLSAPPNAFQNDLKDKLCRNFDAGNAKQRVFCNNFFVSPIAYHLPLVSNVRLGSRFIIPPANICVNILSHARKSVYFFLLVFCLHPPNSLKASLGSA